MSIRLGSAPDSWGIWFASDPRQIEWPQFLDELAEAGYEWMELGPYGYLPTDVRILSSELEKRGLRAIGSFAQAPLENPEVWPSLERQLRRLGEVLAPLNARYVALIDEFYSDMLTGAAVAPRELDEDEWRRLIDTTYRAVEFVKKNFGLRLVFHPHADTHVETEEQVERFLSETDPSAISLCLDTGHYEYRGGDSVALYHRHPHRVEYLHLKTVDRAVRRQKVETENAPFAVAVAEGVFCEPHLGTVDFAALARELESAKYDGWVIVEQDMFPAPPGKALPIGKRTNAYFRNLGFTTRAGLTTSSP